jgi:hypothetical protein
MHEIDQMLQLQLEGRHAEARALSDKLEAIGPQKIQDPKGQTTQDIWMRHCFNRGWFLIQDGDYQKGSQLLENGRFLNVYGNQPLMTNAPIYNPQQHDIKGKGIIISLEGGYGDEIIHARFAQSFKKQGAARVYLAAAPEMVSLFSRIDGVDGVILRNQANTVAHDFWVPGFSAGWVAGHTFEDFPGDPYLTARPESVDVWKNIINSDKIKVGIRWAGNPKFEHQQFRRFPTDFITNLTKYSELQLYSLQRDHNTIQLPEGVQDLQHLMLSWEDTAAAIMNLDLVITSCTSVAHLSAALGKQTWVIVPCLPYHTWTWKAPTSDTSPYYKCVKLFRQRKYGSWNDPWQRLYTELESKFNLAHVDMPNADRESKKLNLGCGFKKFKGYLNVDKSSLVKPDQTVDLNVTPWPWRDNEFTHIVAKDILEHLGETQTDFVNVIKEMYRISENGAIWEIQVPHWRCDTALDDPGHVRFITLGMMHLFNQQRVMNRIKQRESDSILAFEHDIDIEVCDTQFVYTEPWQHKIRNNEVTSDELNYALNHFNNVALSMIMLIQVHKPGRYDAAELTQELNKVNSEL